MPGHKVRNFKQHIVISLQPLVPQDNLYSQADRRIDISFVRDLAVEFCAGFSRPSVDPLVN